MIKIIIITINLTANDHDSGDNNDEIQVQDQKESGTIENMSSSSLTSMDLSKARTDKPMQPVIKYPPTKFGSTNRSFQSKWYEQFPWLEYSISFDAAFCLTTSHVYMPLHIITIENQLISHLITI